jgi:hypothetical protein
MTGRLSPDLKHIIPLIKENRPEPWRWIGGRWRSIGIGEWNARLQPVCGAGESREGRLVEDVGR